MRPVRIEPLAPVPKKVPKGHRRYRISCGLGVGPAKWQSTDSYEADECRGEGIVDIPIGTMLNLVHCPKCGQHLEDESHYERIA